MAESYENPRNMMVATQCRGCGGLQGAFHLVNKGTLELGRMVCTNCGLVDSPAEANPLMMRDGNPPPFVHIEMDDDEHLWPLRPAAGEEQFG